MSHIPLDPKLPGILGPLKFRPETAKPLSELAEILLRGPSTLTQGERETIAAYVSKKNNCSFCHNSHLAAATHALKEKGHLAQQAMEDLLRSGISEKLKRLILIAGKVQEGGLEVTSQDVEAARAQGATDFEIHDTILIAAAFCMYNRYVDGLSTMTPEKGSPVYPEIGKMLVEQGYLGPI